MAGHSHSHSHAHADHGHVHRHGGGEKRIVASFILISLFMLVEAAGGWWSGSLTLLADSGHMLTDSAALALAWMAARAVQRPRDSLRSYGHDRFSVLAALINGLALLAIVIWIAIEAVRRLLVPEHAVAGAPMLAIAIAGLVVNGIAFFLLHGAERDNLNVQGALLHVIGDILGSLAAIIAAVVILTTGWTPADPILSAIAGVLILRNALHLVRRSWRVLMEAAPEGMDSAEIAGALNSVDGVADIHHLHVWALAPGKPLITLHARVAMGYEPDAVLNRIKSVLNTQFKIDHSTIQMEGACPDGQNDHACDEQAQHGHLHGTSQATGFR